MSRPRAPPASTSGVGQLAAPEPGSSWASRWDSLELFTPRRFSGLPGLRFPAGAEDYPSKDEMAAYLNWYAARSALPLVTGTTIRSLQATTSNFEAATDGGSVTAGQVVVADGPYDRPHIPAAAADLASTVQQLHSSRYCRPTDIPSESVHVIGGGNIAAQLACELAGTHDVTVVSSRPPWWPGGGVLRAGGRPECRRRRRAGRRRAG